MTFDEVAGAVSGALGRKIHFVRCDRQQARHALFAAGLSENAADLMLEMYDAAEAGRIGDGGVTP